LTETLIDAIKAKAPGFLGEQDEAFVMDPVFWLSRTLREGSRYN
jgi:hypothetical protein